MWKDDYSDPGYETEDGGLFQPAEPFSYQPMKAEELFDPIDRNELVAPDGYPASYSFTPVSAVGGGGSSGLGPQITARPSTMQLPPVQYQAGELVRADAIYEDGDSEGETQESNYVAVPPSQIQPGEMTKFEALQEHGNYLGESLEQGFMTDSAGEGSVPNTAFSTAAGRSSAPLTFNDLLDIYRRGPLVPGTLRHFLSEYQEGTSKQDDVQYKHNRYPDVPLPSDTQKTVYSGDIGEGYL